MEMSQIRYFIAVSETLSFTRAARRSGVSQPALTKAIQKLENSLGGPLLERTSKTLALTSLGHQLLPQFKEIIDSANHAREEAFRFLSSTENTLKIGVSADIALCQVLDLLEPVRVDYPSLELEFFELPYIYEEDSIESMGLDLVFFCHHSIEMELSKNALLSEDYVVVFGDQHRYLGRSVLSLEDLNGEKFFFRQHCYSSTVLQNTLFSKDMRLLVTCFSSQDSWIKRHLEQYQCISFVPRSFAFAQGMIFASLNNFALQRSIILKRCEKTPQNILVGSIMQTLMGDNKGGYQVA